MRVWAVLAALLLASPVQAAPLTRAVVRVEIEGASAIAAHLRRILPGYLAAELAQERVVAPPGARLVLRVREVFLSSDMGGGDDGFVMPDGLDGEVQLLDARGGVLVRAPVAGRATPVVGTFSTASEPRRVDALAQSFAQAAVRALH